MQNAFNFIQHNLLELHMPAFQWSDALEILVIAFLIYHILRWLRNTRAWTMMRGLAVVGALIVVAALFGMTTILWIVQNVMQIAVWDALETYRSSLISSGPPLKAGKIRPVYDQLKNTVQAVDI